MNISDPIMSQADQSRVMEQKMERAKRLGFLFKHRATFGRHVLVLWPDLPETHGDLAKELVFGTVSSNDDQDSPQSKENEKLSVKFHQTLAMSQLEGDFDIFMDPSKVAEKIQEYNLPAKAPTWLKTEPWREKPLGKSLPQQRATTELQAPGGERRPVEQKSPAGKQPAPTPSQISDFIRDVYGR